MDKKLILWYAVLTLVGITILTLIFGFFVNRKKSMDFTIKNEDIILTSSVLTPDSKYIVTNYAPIARYALLQNGETVFGFRRFDIDGIASVLAVNPNTLKTMILNEEAFENYQKPEEKFSETKFYKLISANLPIKKIEKSGYVLTVDLCEKPVKKERKFESRLFDFLENLSIKKGVSIPVGIAVSGKWIKSEQKSFNRIKALKESGMIDVLWINHSYTHPVNGGKFLTHKSVNFEMEVLETEKYLLEMGEVPSVFFRFPGLVYNQDLLNKLRELYLIPLDANAWIAKGEKINNGSIILIHGNGNEPLGVDKLLKTFGSSGKKKNKDFKEPDFINLYL